MAANRLPTYFISHGGGPWPWMKEELGGAYDRLEAALARMPADIGTTPKAVLMLSAHWEAPEFTLQTNPRPGMLYDYGGFPDFTYRITYAAPGAPDVAARVAELLRASDIAVREDAERGFDHGMFAPMAVIYPKADVPVLQLSLKRGLDPHAHLALGRALAPLRDEGVLIVGSGFFTHNLRAMTHDGQVSSVMSEFDDWGRRALAAHDLDALLDFEHKAPAGRLAHPRTEHFAPLFVTLGAAADELGSQRSVIDGFWLGLAKRSIQLG